MLNLLNKWLFTKLNLDGVSASLYIINECNLKFPNLLRFGAVPKLN